MRSTLVLPLEQNLPELSKFVCGVGSAVPILRTNFDKHSVYSIKPLFGDDDNKVFKRNAFQFIYLPRHFLWLASFLRWLLFHSASARFVCLMCQSLSEIG